MKYLFTFLFVLIGVGVAFVWQANYVMDVVENGIGFVPKSWDVIWWGVAKILAITFFFSVGLQVIVKAILD